MGQRFYANPKTRRLEPNGAVSYAGVGVGHYAKIQNCPVVLDGREIARLTCYATGCADTMWSAPACTRYRGRYVAGHLTSGDDGPQFLVHDRHRARCEHA